MYISFKKIVGDICQFVPEKVETFWMLILSQIETGVLELKSSSLEIQIFLLEKYGLPHDRVIFNLHLLYFIFIIIFSERHFLFCMLIYYDVMALLTCILKQ